MRPAVNESRSTLREPSVVSTAAQSQQMIQFTLGDYIKMKTNPI